GYRRLRKSDLIEAIKGADGPPPSAGPTAPAQAAAPAEKPARKTSSRRAAQAPAAQEQAASASAEQQAAPTHTPDTIAADAGRTGEAEAAFFFTDPAATE